MRGGGVREDWRRTIEPHLVGVYVPVPIPTLGIPRLDIDLFPQGVGGVLVLRLTRHPIQVEELLAQPHIVERIDCQIVIQQLPIRVDDIVDALLLVVVVLAVAGDVVHHLQRALDHAVFVRRRHLPGGVEAQRSRPRDHGVEHQLRVGSRGCCGLQLQP